MVMMYGWDGEVRGETTLPGRIFDQPLRVDIAHASFGGNAPRREAVYTRRRREERCRGRRERRDRRRVRDARAWAISRRRRCEAGRRARAGGALHAHKLPKKVRRMGLKVALSAKAAEGN